MVISHHAWPALAMTVIAVDGLNTFAARRFDNRYRARSRPEVETPAGPGVFSRVSNDLKPGTVPVL